MSDFIPKYFRVIDTSNEPEPTYILESLETQPELDFSTQKAIQLPSKPVIEEDTAVIDGKPLRYQPIENTIVIQGEVFEDVNMQCHDFYGVKELDNDFYVAEDENQAGIAARSYWEDMMNSDPEEFACLIGTESLVQWGMGQLAGPGTTKVHSVQEWLDLFLTDYASELAGYDGEERDIDFCSEDLIEELGYIPTMAFRNN